MSRAALGAGASGLGVALVEEGVQLREAGIDAMVLVLSEPVAEAAETVVEHRLTPVVYTGGGIEALAKAVSSTEGADPLDVHLKIDTGMHRVGCAPERRGRTGAPDRRASGTAARGNLHTLRGGRRAGDVPTPRNSARASKPSSSELRGSGLEPGIVHACNTAGTIAFPNARYDMVRAGIGVYGIAPAPALEGCVPLQPALSVCARVSFVKTVPAGTGVSYGLRYSTARPSRIATVPIGYADGVPRAIGERGGVALVRGHRCEIAGTVTMDQLMLDVGDLPVEVGEEVVLLGTQGGETVTAADWAALVDTIAYEIVCGIGPRVPRIYTE